MSSTQPQQTNPWGAEQLIQRFYRFVDSLSPAKQKTYALGWLVIAAVLMVVASLPLPDGFRWVASVVGSPAGVIIFLLGLGFVHATNLQNHAPFTVKETHSPRKRLPFVIIGLVAVAAILISTSAFLPIGVGGTIVIVAALTAYNAIRRTPDELYLAAQGLPDPREFEEEEEEV